MDNKQKLCELLGEVSMCWTEIPKGVFKSERVMEIADEIDALYYRDCGKCKNYNYDDEKCDNCRYYDSRYGLTSDNYEEADK